MEYNIEASKGKSKKNPIRTARNNNSDFKQKNS